MGKSEIRGAPRAPTGRHAGYEAGKAGLRRLAEEMVQASLAVMLTGSEARVRVAHRVRDAMAAALRTTDRL
jgi:hypothetical protein